MEVAIQAHLLVRQVVVEVVQVHRQDHIRHLHQVPALVLRELLVVRVVEEVAVEVLHHRLVVDLAEEVAVLHVVNV